MDAARRKAHLKAYKERKLAAGLYAVRCAPTGGVWVGRATDLDAIRRRLDFELGLGSWRGRSLQAAWTAHGADAFGIETLEIVEEKDPYLRDKRLAARLDHWRATLAADAA